MLWLAIVLALGSASFGPGQTQRRVLPLLRVLAPWMPPSSAILAVLWAQALGSQRWFSLRTAW